MSTLKKLALVVGGGPAPGINGVISAVTLEAINNGISVFGIQDGYKWLVKGRTDRIRRLGRDDVKGIFIKGGSILGTARTNPTKDPEDMKRVLGTFQEQGFDALVSIGGDDTAYTASRIYEEAGGRIKVVHVPKTIDNDLPLGPSQPTFGFETARHVGVQVVRNLAEDARTTSRWYLIVSMGRAAGHLALGIGKASSATLTIIPEEFEGNISLDHLCDIIIGSIVKRAARDTHYGVVVLAEGLIESVGAKNLRALMESGTNYYGVVSEDPHGNLRLGQIDFGRMIKDRLTERLRELHMEVAFIDKDLGYELRCADPIPFDVEYTRDLGYGAVKFLRSPEASKFGAVVSLVDGKLNPKPFATMLDPKTKRMATRRVNIQGEGFESARRYMIRLEKGDLENPEALAKLADQVKMTPEAFKTRFYHVAG
jgi:6-phosphofructokinase 1